MNKAEEFLENNCLWINERHWRHGEKKLYQIGAKTLEQYAQLVAVEFAKYCVDEDEKKFADWEHRFEDFNHQNQQQ